MKNLIEGLKIGEYANRQETTEAIQKQTHQAAELSTINRLSFMIIWALLMAFCFETWFLVISGVSTHLAYLK